MRFHPYKIGKAVGFTKLEELHNQWMVDMINGCDDETLQAHRGSYKTTCVSISLAIIMVLWPNIKICFIRSTDKDAVEIVKQTANILQSQIMSLLVRELYGIDLVVEASSNKVDTNLSDDQRGTPQLIGRGMGGSITGQHYDRIFTDDIVNIDDRVSQAARESTKRFYQELQNIKNRDGRIFNTGTPWHREDCFSIMPNIKRFDCYETHLIDDDTLYALKKSMTRSLFAANYELKHIADEDALFTEPEYTSNIELLYDGVAHIDAAYGGDDDTAFTIVKIRDGKMYVFGKKYQKHVDDCLDDILRLKGLYRAGRTFVETNADKGYLQKELKKRGDVASSYHESMNKYIKISTYLKGVWDKVVFIDSTDPEYIAQILDYNENAQHDDCPDSLACMARRFWKKLNRREIGEYKSILM